MAEYRQYTTGPGTASPIQQRAGSEFNFYLHLGRVAPFPTKFIARRSDADLFCGGLKRAAAATTAIPKQILVARAADTGAICNSRRRPVSDVSTGAAPTCAALR
jgi:hypothetical protein